MADKNRLIDPQDHCLLFFDLGKMRSVIVIHAFCAEVYQEDNCFA